jgi:ADP-heptose:LPS heptosyltransferase
VKVLVIRFSSIGDIVLTSPVMRCMHEQIPGIEIHYVTKKNYESILSSNPFITKCFVLENDLSSLIDQLKKENYDYVIDLHNNLRSFWVKLMLGKIAFTVSKSNFKKMLMVKLKIRSIGVEHVVERYLKTVKRLGVKNDGKGLNYFIPVKDEIPISDLPLTHIHGYVGLVIGAKHNTKKMPFEKLQTLCRKIPVPIVLLGGNEDAATAEKIRETDPIKVYNACGKFNLNQSASLVKQAKYIITHDTGLMHIAAALQKNIISVWGNTIPGFGMYPYFGSLQYGTNTSIEVKGLPCRPCSKLGFEKCPKKHFKCMIEINPDEIVNILNKN